MELIPLVLLTPLLVATGYSDLRYMKIPNRLSIATVALFMAISFFILPLDSIMQRMLISLAFLVIGFIGFALNIIGGGDAKMLSALMLFIPPGTLSLFMLLFAASLLFGIVFLLTLRATPVGATASWLGLQRGARFPMGISIAMAGLTHPVALFALHA